MVKSIGNILMYGQTEWNYSDCLNEFSYSKSRQSVVLKSVERFHFRFLIPVEYGNRQNYNLLKKIDFLNIWSFDKETLFCNFMNYEEQ